MSDVSSDYVELLPARTVLSTFAQGADGGKGGDTDLIGSILSHVHIMENSYTSSGTAGSAGSTTNGL
ncbi:MAG TPA: hypothetical protein VN748_21670 [Pseudonocardiaceae bacterium]|jgi:hypothetical protein|nr:hypothetical protein [Pseudonocardiaceae bacterium]